MGHYILGILVAATLLLAWLARSLYVNAGRLRNVGVTAKGTVVKILGSKQPSTYYEFITMTQSLGKGIHRLVPGQKEYATGETVEITYLPDRPSISSITEYMDAKITFLETLSKTMGFTALSSAVLLSFLLFLMVKYNIS